jgi:cytochrome c oxidase subunit 4
MTDTLETTTEDPAHDNHHGPSDKQFIGIFFFLAAVTALEVLVSYIDIGAFFLPVLLALMVLKFFTVVWYFMHVKFDNPLFGRLFYIGLGLAVVVYAGALSTFQFFAG